MNDEMDRDEVLEMLRTFRQRAQQDKKAEGLKTSAVHALLNCMVEEGVTLEGAVTMNTDLLMHHYQVGGIDAELLAHMHNALFAAIPLAEKYIMTARQLIDYADNGAPARPFDLEEYESARVAAEAQENSRRTNAEFCVIWNNAFDHEN